MRISNTRLYACTPTVQKPEIPKYFYEEENRWIENPNDPQYHFDKEMYELLRGDEALKLIINSQVVDIKPTNEDINMLSVLGDESEDFEYLYKRYITFGDSITEVINDSCLTEPRIYSYFEQLYIYGSRGGNDILEYPLKFGVNITTTFQPLIINGLQLASPMDEYSCCVDSNIEWLSWLRNELTLDEMAQTIALWRISKLLDSHKNDELQIESERKSKKK